jgi:leucyl-tRNA synthetase
MAEYNFREIEKKWQAYWSDNQTFATKEEKGKPKYYVLDMFPYPSGKGLHVGHPLGYIATDIVARYKRITGFNVLHPMGFDSFGLPAEQYAIKTGQHPQVTTANNIERFKEQLSILGFSYDWSTEIRTSDVDYYRWTQWIFLKLFNSYFDEKEKKAKPIAELKVPGELIGKARDAYIDNHRLAYQDEIMVNWCPELGTVLANEEVVGGVSEVGGYPVIRKPMRQWMMRITSYADRLLQDMQELEWPESIKLSQKNWIGRSVGADIYFTEKSTGKKIQVFTTRPDTIFGATYIVLAPEHSLVAQITTDDQKEKVEGYVEKAAQKSDLERAELDKTKTGVFTGSYAINPVNNEELPIWISDYVLISYGYGAIMAVPAGDQRDFEFAIKFNLPIREVVSKSGKESSELIEAYSEPGIIINSGSYNGMASTDFFYVIVKWLEENDHGKGAVNYKLRDWVFTRQRYWGEPIPIIHTEDGRVVGVPEDQLPVVLPEVESYTGTRDGLSPLAKAVDWVNTINPEDGRPAKRETNTMPQWAGSCWYYLRYLDNKNENEFVPKEKENYWLPVDLYVGGAEHAVLHLLYSRFWHKVLFDLGYINSKEPFRKLINQGMISGKSNFVYRIQGSNKYVSLGLKDQFESDPIHVDVNIVNDDILDLEAFKAYSSLNNDAEFVLEDGKYVCGFAIEKMSKSLLNVVNPDTLVEKYGADTFRMYEMFLGPLEQAKPWNTNGIDGVWKFLKRFWNLYHDESGKLSLSGEDPSQEELKILHKTIKKIKQDIERYSFNTAVSAFMICVNELTPLKCNKEKILQPLLITLSPFAPHLAEEIWAEMGNTTSISFTRFPDYDETHIQEDSFEYPIAINGKMRVKMKFALDMPSEDIEKMVLASEIVKKWTDGKTPRKVIIVPKKIVNIVV